MKRILFLLSLSAAAMLLQTGCVVGRRTVALPVATTAAPAPTRGAVHVASVADQRGFMNKPTDPSVPSIDGDVATLTEETKGVMIGRQRNSYGKALGDIALPAGDSVAKRARLLIEEGLRQRGFSITDDANAPQTASVTVNEFWAWFSPGMFSVGFEARVQCKLELNQGGKKTVITVLGYGENRGQVASDANWQLAYDRAFKDFIVKLQLELEKAGF